MSEYVPASELRSFTEEELNAKLNTLELEYQKVRQQKHSQSVQPDDIKTAKKNVARCKGIIKEKMLERLVEEYKGKKYMPKELRPKLNKAKRMALTHVQKTLKSKRQRFQAVKYKKVVYAFNN
ncbi:large subunit ribosomal protein L35e [Enteropsectra breve]|nr:large subunit ribosomal protein L35e [Enteropsectra breve]